MSCIRQLEYANRAELANAVNHAGHDVSALATSDPYGFGHPVCVSYVHIVYVALWALCIVSCSFDVFDPARRDSRLRLVVHSPATATQALTAVSVTDSEDFSAVACNYIQQKGIY